MLAGPVVATNLQRMCPLGLASPMAARALHTSWRTFDERTSCSTRNAHLCTASNASQSSNRLPAVSGTARAGMAQRTAHSSPLLVAAFAASVDFFGALWPLLNVARTHLQHCKAPCKCGRTAQLSQSYKCDQPEPYSDRSMVFRGASPACIRSSCQAQRGGIIVVRCVQPSPRRRLMPRRTMLPHQLRGGLMLGILQRQGAEMHAIHQRQRMLMTPMQARRPPARGRSRIRISSRSCVGS